MTIKHKKKKSILKRIIKLKTEDLINFAKKKKKETFVIAIGEKGI